MHFDSTTSYTLSSKFVEIYDEDLNSPGSKKTNAKASILISSQVNRRRVRRIEHQDGAPLRKEGCDISLFKLLGIRKMELTLKDRELKIREIDQRQKDEAIYMSTTDEELNPVIRREAMAEEDAFLVNDVEGGLCADNTDAGIDGRCNSESNKDKGKESWDSLEFKYMAEDSSSKKFLVSNFNNYKMIDSRSVMEHYNELLRILGQYTQHGLKMDESISVSSIIDKLPPSWKDFKHTLKHGKDDLSLVQLGSHLHIEESLRAQESDKGKGKEVVGPLVNMIEEGGKNKNNKQNKGKKRGFKDNNGGSGSNKKPKLECCKCCKTGHFKRDCRSGNKKNNASASGSGKGSKDQSQDQGQNLVHVDAIAWWIDSGATTHVCKDHCCSGKSITLFNVLYVPKLHKNLISGPVLNKCGYKQVYESDKYILSKSGVFVGFGYYNNGMFMLNLNKVPDDSGSVYMFSSTVVNFSLWHARLGYVHYKRMLEMSKDDLIPAIDENIEKCSTCMLTKITRQPFKSITRKSVILELIHSDLCDFHATPSLGNKKYLITFINDASRFCYVYLLHAKDEALDKFRIYKTEVELQQNNLIKTLRTDKGGEYYDPVFFQSVGIIHETTAPYTPQQNGVAKRKNKALKEMINSIAVVRLPDPKRKTLGEKGIDCIFVGYAEHSKAYRFYVIEPNDYVSINTIIESIDAIFDENRFSLIHRPKDIIPNSNESQMDDHSNDVPSETPEPRKGKRVRKAKSYGFDFQKYLVEGSRDQIGSQYSYCYCIKEDPRTYNEAMQSRDSCKLLGCKWIFKRKMQVDGTIDKFKARLVIQGFRQKEGINYFDTFALVARITTIKLLLALAAIHNLMIHQMDAKTTFLNGDLEEEVYMKQPEGFVMPRNEHKVCKLVKSLFGLKQTHKQWHQKFNEVVLSNGFLLNQFDKYVYSKFNGSDKGVIIYLYVENMLIFGTDQNQVDKTKKFVSSKFSMKDMGEANIILGIKIKRENKGIVC
ncbi:zinc finger, CCHC-type containing protein [Tanacetum coccineum]